MRQLIFVLFLFLSNLSHADQLAYISKEDADKAVLKIAKMKSLVLFCGCCSLVEPVEVIPTNVYSRYTNYENYYEVVIEYMNEHGDMVSTAIDLAYVWRKKGNKFKTVGKILKLDHDFCVKPNDWDNPSFIEKDI